MSNCTVIRPQSNALGAGFNAGTRGVEPQDLPNSAPLLTSATAPEAAAIAIQRSLSISTSRRPLLSEDCTTLSGAVSRGSQVLQMSRWSASLQLLSGADIKFSSGGAMQLVPGKAIALGLETRCLHGELPKSETCECIEEARDLGSLHQRLQHLVGHTCQPLVIHQRVAPLRLPLPEEPIPVLEDGLHDISKAHGACHVGGH
mmetsp:Transcript_23191/g.64326  ORF Transcript_23191/g.64326 Transcript_23191/m.64326 type:complete len:202 (-) Transcript_23191:670-1275(-)